MRELIIDPMGPFPPPGLNEAIQEEALVAVAKGRKVRVLVMVARTTLPSHPKTRDSEALLTEDMARLTREGERFRKLLEGDSELAKFVRSTRAAREGSP